MSFFARRLFRRLIYVKGRKMSVTHLASPADILWKTLEEYGFDYWFSSKNNTVILNKPQWYRNGESLGTLPGYAANVVGQEAVNWLDRHRDPLDSVRGSVHARQTAQVQPGGNELGAVEDDREERASRGR